MDSNWVKSSYSFSNGACVEVRHQSTVQVRDSQDPDGPVLKFDGSTWGKWLATVKQP